MSEKNRDKGIKGLTTDVLSGRVPPVLPGQMELDLKLDLGPTVNITDIDNMCDTPVPADTKVLTSGGKLEFVLGHDEEARKHAGELLLDSVDSEKTEEFAEGYSKAQVACLDRAAKALSCPGSGAWFDIMEEFWPGMWMSDKSHILQAHMEAKRKEDDLKASVQHDPLRRPGLAEFLPDWHDSVVNPDSEASRVFIKPSDEPAYMRLQTTSYGEVDAKAFNAFLSEGELAVSYFSAYDGRQGAIQANCYSGEECPMSAIVNESDDSLTALNDVELEPLKTAMICTIVSKSGVVFVGSFQAEPWEPVNLEWLRKQAYNEAFSKYKAAAMFYFQHEVYQQVLLDKQMAMREEGERRFEAQMQKEKSE